VSAYRMLNKEGTCTFHKIVHGRKWVGRVVQHTDGHWLGIIGKNMVKRPTAVAAFEQVVAEQLGYSSAAALRQRNAVVRQKTRLVNAAADAAYRQVLGGKFDVFDTPQGALLALRGATRDLRRK
jgi:hypothetical protein